MDLFLLKKKKKESEQTFTQMSIHDVDSFKWNFLSQSRKYKQPEWLKLNETISSHTYILIYILFKKFLYQLTVALIVVIYYLLLEAFKHDHTLNVIIYDKYKGKLILQGELIKSKVCYSNILSFIVSLLVGSLNGDNWPLAFSQK